MTLLLWNIFYLISRCILCIFYSLLSKCIKEDNSFFLYFCFFLFHNMHEKRINPVIIIVSFWCFFFVLCLAFSNAEHIIFLTILMNGYYIQYTKRYDIRYMCDKKNIWRIKSGWNWLNMLVADKLRSHETGKEYAKRDCYDFFFKYQFPLKFKAHNSNIQIMRTDIQIKLKKKTLWAFWPVSAERGFRLQHENM